MVCSQLACAYPVEELSILKAIMIFSNRCIVCFCFLKPALLLLVCSLMLLTQFVCHHACPELILYRVLGGNGDMYAQWSYEAN